MTLDWPFLLERQGQKQTDITVLGNFCGDVLYIGRYIRMKELKESKPPTRINIYIYIEQHA